ncbi:hypothetical protein FWF74_02695 [Candidatus Saccharibacteria bacterium]|nr:hypothetical protein [Candidatus Saccharibacteria bacterium]MCL1962735.1 hypothetical protein [Candidatus Saccharibacteria bacterium]
MLTAQADAARARKSGKNVITTDPADYLGEQECKAQQFHQTLGNAGILLTNSRPVLNISEKDWSIRDQIKFGIDKGLLYTKYRTDTRLEDVSKNKYRDLDYLMSFFNQLTQRQILPTGVVLAADAKLQMRGMRLDVIQEHTRTFNQEVRAVTAGKLGIRMLGLVPNLGYYIQSKEKQEEMRTERIAEQTLDLFTDQGSVANLSDWRKEGRVGINWAGYSNPCYGSRLAVVDSDTSEAQPFIGHRIHYSE